MNSPKLGSSKVIMVSLHIQGMNVLDMIVSRSAIAYPSGHDAQRNECQPVQPGIAKEAQ